MPNTIPETNAAAASASTTAHLPEGRRRAVLGVPTAPHTILALDGVRGLAASLVFLVHYHAAFGALVAPRSSLFDASAYLAAVGYHGVDLFFVLSGYLIYGALVGKSTRYSRFFARRIRRIYPTFLVVLALYLALSAAMPSRSKLPSADAGRYVLQNALLLPGVFEIEPIVTVAWSLSYEIFYYVGIAAVVAALALRRWSGGARIALFSGVVLLWVLAAPVRGAVGSFVMFLPGILLYELTRTTGRNLRLPVGVELLGWGAFLLAIFGVPRLVAPGRALAVGPALVPTSVVAFLGLGLSIAALLFVAGFARGWTDRLFGSTPLRFVGLSSYSFYLIHGLTINAAYLVFTRLGGGALAPLSGLAYWSLAVVVYLACVATGTALFVAVERRFLL